MMARQTVGQPPANQLHIDLGALAQRVTGIENAFSSFADSVSSQIRDLGTKIDAQGTSFAASRSTNWTSFISATAAVVAVLITIGGAIIWPLISDLNKVSATVSKIQDNYAKTADVITAMDRNRDRIARLEANITALDTAKIDVREHEEFKTRIDAGLRDETSARKETGLAIERALRELDSQLVKRPEIEASNKALGQRIDVMATHYDALQKQVNDALAGAVNGLAAKGH